MAKREPKRDNSPSLPDFDAEDEQQQDEAARKRAISLAAESSDEKRTRERKMDQNIAHDELLRRLEVAEKKLEAHNKKFEETEKKATVHDEDIQLVKRQAVQTYVQWISDTRDTASRKAVIKGWWRFQFDSRRSAETMSYHREDVCEWLLDKAGYDVRNACTAIVSKQGTTLLPITSIEFRDAEMRNEFIRKMKEMYSCKVQEWETQHSKNLYWASGGAGGHRPLLIESQISDFDRKQSYVMKCIMTATKEVLQITEFRHDWREMSIWDDSGYIAWISFDLEHNTAKCYFAEEKVTSDLREDFERRITKEMQLITSGQQKGKPKGDSKGKAKGKGKHKGKDDEKEEEPDEEMPEGSEGFVPGEDSDAYAYHLTQRMQKIGVTNMQIQGLKLRTTYLMEFSYISHDDFDDRYKTAMNKVANRLAKPAVCLEDC
eukprot:TRINITY_DN1480_c0_g1_i3.p1 TRINITY_DN1480_c0_g1~~TRINITY_DN1480_c0_g1_i3.p1  ORF type:complete len:432 (-),score=98.12 TRINITY_DN1480_c0_g1_i3:374-1669(-)